MYDHGVGIFALMKIWSLYSVLYNQDSTNTPTFGKGLVHAINDATRRSRPEVIGGWTGTDTCPFCHKAEYIYMGISFQN